MDVVHKYARVATFTTHARDLDILDITCTDRTSLGARLKYMNIVTVLNPLAT